MLKKVLTLLFVFAFLLSGIAFAGVKKEQRKIIVPPGFEVFSNDVLLPGIQAAPKNPVVANAVTTPAEGVVIGTTDYDYMGLDLFS